MEYCCGFLQRLADDIFWRIPFDHPLLIIHFSLSLNKRRGPSEHIYFTAGHEMVHQGHNGLKVTYKRSEIKHPSIKATCLLG